MIPRGGSTSPKESSRALLDEYGTYAMFPRMVYNPLGIIACPPRVVQDPRDDS